MTPSSYRRIQMLLIATTTTELPNLETSYFWQIGMTSTNPYIGHPTKSKRVSSSVLGGETMAFADAFDMKFAIKNDMELMITQPLPIVMLTDSLSLFEVITKSTITTEKRLMIEIKVVKDSYQCNEVQNIWFIRSGSTPADALTKIKRCKVLDQILVDSTLIYPIEQWIKKRK